MTATYQRAAQVEAARVDGWLLAVLAALLLLGLETVFSASFVFSLAEFGDANYLIMKQLMWASIGVVLLVVLSRFDYHRWLPLSPLILFIALAGLVAVQLPVIGFESNGARRWVQIPPLPPVQPAEFAKLALIIYLSAWMATREANVRRFWSGTVPFVLITGLVFGLVYVQPDLGTATILVALAGTLFFIAGADLKQVVLMGVGAGTVAMPIVLAAGYRANRMEAFLDPWQDPLGKGFHIIQSLIALGSGGLTGLGLGASRQKFFYVPGSHTDAIYAIIGEELGLIGTMLVLVLFGTLAYRGFRIVLRSPDRFGALLASGITCWFLIQAMINIGGITKLIPFTGVTLPFISFGGSSLAVTMAAAGILLNISRQCRSLTIGSSKLDSP